MRATCAFDIQPHEADDIDADDIQTLAAAVH